MFLVELIASSFLDLISKQARPESRCKHILVNSCFTLSLHFQEWTDKGVSSRGSRVRTKFYASIIDSRSDRVLNIYNLTIIVNLFNEKVSLFMCLSSHFNLSVVVSF